MRNVVIAPNACSQARHVWAGVIIGALLINLNIRRRHDNRHWLARSRLHRRAYKPINHNRLLNVTSSSPTAIAEMIMSA